MQTLGLEVLAEREIVIGTDENTPLGMFSMAVTDEKIENSRVRSPCARCVPVRYRPDGRGVPHRPGRSRGQRVLVIRLVPYLYLFTFDFASGTPDA